MVRLTKRYVFLYLWLNLVAPSLPLPPSLPSLPSSQPDTEAGDVIVILQQMDHTTFKRNDIDLFVEKKVSLVKALCGFSFVLEHLDGRKLLVKCPPGDVLSPGKGEEVFGQHPYDALV